ncbi:PREDICTED: uncharacterized protein LOC106804710 [Priapulus caudatus]|uniref:RNA-directed DNA polymerase n=1 Tax=Priapulus caudatus TaxID=37621 RepID=A0ABM1DNG5_PRICU|nr:PREDICTED: uncharacterized protein LOC106804710 [Priapulus caudatus]
MAAPIPHYLQYPAFDCRSEAVGIRWTKWINRLKNNIFVAYDISDDTRRKALMLTQAGDESHEKELSDPKLTLSQLVEFARTLQLTDNQHKEMTSNNNDGQASTTAPVNRIQRKKPQAYKSSYRKAQSNSGQPASDNICVNCVVGVNGVPINMMIDTGSSVDVVDESTWQKLQPSPTLEDAHTTLIPYGSINWEAFTSCQYPGLSEGVGKLKNFSVKFHIDDSVQPIALPHRRVPFHLRQKVEDKVRELEDLDIIEEVEGPTPWNAIRDTLKGLDGVLNVSDDILVYGRSNEEHDKRLHATLQRLHTCGLTINKDKCRFGQSSLTYLGYTFSREGVSPDPQKVSDIQNAPTPENATEVRSLLGLANYCARFILSVASITAPLRELARKDTEWSWTQRHQDALEDLKSALTSDAVMGYFDPTKQSEVLVDASPVGVAAVLTQKSGDEMTVISYASRALSSVEQRYSQTEREALAVVFGCEKIHLYLYGSHFIILTDHRPLLGIFNNPRSTPPARIERWVLRLQQYDMMLQYRPGKDNPADFTSRHPGNSASCSRAEIIGEEYINFLAQASTPIALTLDGIRAATAGDKEMQDVIKAIRSDIHIKPSISRLMRNGHLGQNRYS